MTRNWHHPDHRPTPAELNAWADGELDAADAARVEAWLLAHPEAEAEVEASSRLVGLFREYPPADPGSAAWDTTLNRIVERTRGRSRWQAMLYLSVGTAAAVLFAVVVANRVPSGSTNRGMERAVVALPAGDDNDEPFAVAAAGEVNIVHMDARDADRVLVGQPLLDSFEVVGSEDIELVSVEADWEEGHMPRLQRGTRFPMVVVARATDEP